MQKERQGRIVFSAPSWTPIYTKQGTFCAADSLIASSTRFCWWADVMAGTRCASFRRQYDCASSKMSRESLTWTVYTTTGTSGNLPVHAIYVDNRNKSPYLDEQGRHALCAVVEVCWIPLDIHAMRPDNTTRVACN